MGSFGERLQRERATRKISLEEIATATKIGTRNLRALETEDFESLPGGIFNRGFVRSYARYLGLDEELMVAEYVAAEGGRYQPKLPFSSEDIERKPVNVAAWTQLILIVLVLAGATYAALTYSSQIAHLWKRLVALRHATIRISEAAADPLPAPKPVAPPAPTQAAAVVEDTSAAVTPVSMPIATHEVSATATSAALNLETTAAPKAVALPKTEEPLAETTAAGLPTIKSQGAGQFVVHIRARQDAWLSINADGRKLMEGTLSASGERSFRAAHNLVLVTGNAGGVEISFNGKLLPTLGAERQPKKVLFTEQGLRQ